MLLEISWNYIRPQNSKFALTLISTMYICTHTYMSEKQLLNADAINLTHIKILEGELLWQVKDDHNGSFENPLEHIQIQIKVTQSKRLSLKRQKMKFISCRFLMHPAGSGVWQSGFFPPFFQPWTKAYHMKVVLRVNIHFLMMELVLETAHHLTQK